MYSITIYNLTQWTWGEQTPEDNEGQGSLVCCSPLGSQRVGHNLVTEQQLPAY